MKEEEAVDLLRYYRHDWLNDLQVIMGYAQMGKLAKVEEKIANAVTRMDADQKLQSIPFPKTVIAIMQFYWNSEQFRLTPKVDSKITIALDDTKLANQINQIFTAFSEHAMNLVLYHGTIRIQEMNQVQLEITFEFSERFEQLEELKVKLAAIDTKIDISNHEAESIRITWVAN